MSGLETKPLFVDTGAFFAHFVEDSPRHHRARAVMDRIQSGTLRYRPIYTSSYVLSELATLLLRKKNHDAASDALDRIEASPMIRTLHPDDEYFRDAVAEFQRYDDQQISFVDHMSSVLASAYTVDHVFGFDNDFRTLDFTLVPDDIQIPDGI